MTIYLGTQGWSYKDWIGGFYPPGTRATDFLEYYAQVFDAVELDTTFYGIPRAAQVDRWRESTPEHFRFTAKTPKSITHDRRLVDAHIEFREFLRVIGRLEDKLGAVLIQLPPDFTAHERPALEAFFQTLPEGISFAAEFRHRSWLQEETYDLLRRHDVALTIIDLSYMPIRTDITAHFAYFRWLGDRRQIERMNEVQIDRGEDLDRWAQELDRVAQHVQRVYGFANNHYSGHSPADIRHLRSRLGMPERLPPQQPVQRSLL